MSAVLRKVITTDGLHLIYYCQGCEDTHQVRVRTPENQRPSWEWDGNMDAPTFSPSVLVTYDGADSDGEEGLPSRCHTFIKAGMVQFLTDCTHALAGQTLPLPPWPYADGEYGGVTRLIIPEMKEPTE